jgi:chitinase
VSGSRLVDDHCDRISLRRASGSRKIVLSSLGIPDVGLKLASTSASLRRICKLRSVQPKARIRDRCEFGVKTLLEEDMSGIAPPRNVIYFNDGTYPLADIASLPYTDVIIGFLIPDDNLKLEGAGGAFDDNLQSNIQTLQNAGKNVLISVGGDVQYFSSSAWQYYAQNVSVLVSQIVNVVNSYGLNGVDIDYEDDNGFTETYDGIGFLSALTSGLAEALSPGRNIITHAPQTPYWDPQGGYNEGYTRIWQKVGGQITWINNQFYNNSQYDARAADKVNWYQKIAAITGPQKLLVGVTLDPGTEGYNTLDDMANNVITPLKATFGTSFGGAMGWEFSLDIEDQDGIWGRTIASALGLPSSGSWNANDLTAATNPGFAVPRHTWIGGYEASG